MALVPECERCKLQRVQLYPVLNKQVCRKCIKEVEVFLDTPPVSAGSARHSYAEQAIRSAQARGYVSAREIATANNEPYRRAYFRLIKLSQSGRLVHQGDGMFVLPKPHQEAV